MELLNVLESRVLALLKERQTLREQVQDIHVASSEAVSGYAALLEENRQLREKLAEEKRIKDAVLHRVDALISRLQDMENRA